MITFSKQNIEGLVLHRVLMPRHPLNGVEELAIEKFCDDTFEQWSRLNCSVYQAYYLWNYQDASLFCIRYSEGRYTGEKLFV